ncbi:MAG: ABC transporter permease [Chloroflexi bacterium]|nr:ABC transporter permease [Chloroflexota bacterium]
MIRVFDIALKDLLQMMRDGKTFMFLLIMPIGFTLLFGYAFGGFSDEQTDSRLPVGYLDQDQSWISERLYDLLADSDVIRLYHDPAGTASDLEQSVVDEELAAAIVIPDGYGKASGSGKRARLVLIADTAAPAGTTVEAEILAAANRLDSAVSTAIAIEQAVGDQVPFDYAFDQALSAWEDPPIAVAETTSTAIESQGSQSALAHSAPGMMLQFAIAGLLTAAQIIVAERKSRALQRLLTTATRRVHILVGHYMAIFTLVFIQFMALILFGWLILKLDYVREIGATLLVAFSAVTCIAAMGLLIGVIAKSEEQAIMFSLIPMFVLSGLGGAWVPLEVTGPMFQAVGHVSPVAWAMDGFENILIRGMGIESVLLPAGMLLLYGVVFFALAVWRFKFE